MNAYQKLENHFSEVNAFIRIKSRLSWDKAVVMPEKGIEQRARQMAVVSVRIRDMMADPRVGEWVAAVDRGDLNPWQAANLNIMEELHNLQMAIPADLVARKMVQEARTEKLWQEARADDDFNVVKDELDTLLGLVREYAAVRAEYYKSSPYDALLTHFAPGMTSAQVDSIFDELADFLPGFIDDVIQRQKDPVPVEMSISESGQRRLCRRIATLLGFDFKRGRLDISAHPFTSGIGDDVRITTRFSDENFMQSLIATAHEVGHALYDRYTPQEWHEQLVGDSQNMGEAIHESQSLILDMQLARSTAYWEHIGPIVRDELDVIGPAFTNENLLLLSRHVTRGLHRLAADEVTYPAHVIFRYRLEREMVDNKLQAKDLPDAWRAKMRDIIGVEPETDADGCLQDVHWYTGYFGYFPCYALGAIIAAQFAEKMDADIPDLEQHIHRGDFHTFTHWLNTEIHAKGCLYRPMDLIRHVTGKDLTVTPYKEHLQKRYGSDV